MNNTSRITHINELPNHINSSVNLLGVVLEFSFPRKSKGTDYVSILKIVDETQQSPELTVHIFTKTVDDLPNVKSHGDLILLRGVVIREFDDRLSAVFYKHSSSFALFDGKLSNDVSWYEAYPRFRLTDSEKDRISGLRAWCAGVEFSSGLDDYLVTVDGISENSYFDIICRVFRVSRDVTKDMWTLYVWDGTDVPPLSLHGKLKDEEHNPLPLHVVPLPSDHDLLSDLPKVGTVLRVTTDEAHKIFGQHFDAVTKWVRIRNMTCKVTLGMWHGFLTSSSRLRLLTSQDRHVQDYIRRFSERIEKEHGRVPQWSDPSHLSTVVAPRTVAYLTTSFRGRSVVYVTLMDVLTCRKPLYCCCVVRVMAAYPFRAKEFYTSNEYSMRLTLEDPTARIHAVLCGEKWVKFFGGSLPACDVLNGKIKKLLGVPKDKDIDDEVMRNPPWIQCGLFTRVCDHRADVVNYIWGTTLLA